MSLPLHHQRRRCHRRNCLLHAPPSWKVYKHFLFLFRQHSLMAVYGTLLIMTQREQQQAAEITLTLHMIECRCWRGAGGQSQSTQLPGHSLRKHLLCERAAVSLLGSFAVPPHCPVAEWPAPSMHAAPGTRSIGRDRGFHRTGGGDC